MQMSKELFYTIVLAVSLFSLAVMNEYLRSRDYEPAFLSRVDKDVKARCKSTARSGSHNIAFLGGPGAEYYVALEDCIREHQSQAAVKPVRH